LANITEFPISKRTYFAPNLALGRFFTSKEPCDTGCGRGMRILQSAGSIDIVTMVPSDAPQLSASPYPIPHHFRYVQEFVVLCISYCGFYKRPGTQLIEVLPGIWFFF